LKKFRPTPGVVLAVIALFVAMSGSAVASKLITGKDVKNQSLTGSDIRNGSVHSGDLSPGVRAALGKAGTPAKDGVNGAQGPAGPAGPTGSAGPKGDKGDAGVSGYEVKTYDYIGDSAAGTGAIATVACSPGKVATGGGYFFRNGADASAPYGDPKWAFSSPAGTDGTTVIASFPGRMDWDTFTVKPGDNTGWIVQVNSASANAHDLTVYVICTSVK
jgi:hypothetical protein